MYGMNFDWWFKLIWESSENPSRISYNAGELPPFFLSERQWKMCAFSVTPNYRTSFSKRIFSLLHRNHSLIIISYRRQPIQELLFAVFPENEMFSIPQILTPVLSQRLLSFSLSLPRSYAFPSTFCHAIFPDVLQHGKTIMLLSSLLCDSLATRCAGARKPIKLMETETNTAKEKHVETSKVNGFKNRTWNMYNRLYS